MSALLNVLQESPVWIFVDAVDECGDENAIKLVDYFKLVIMKTATALFPIRLVQWISSSTRPLSVGEMRWALAGDDPFQRQNSLQQWQLSEEYSRDNTTMESKIRTFGCGLIETVPHGGEGESRIVQFIHQSLQDFFLKWGLSTLEALNGYQTSPQIAVGHAHYTLARTCILYLTAAAEINCAILQRARSLILDIDAPDDQGWTPLLCAVFEGCSAITKLLLDTNKVHVNARDQCGRTALALAAERGHEAIVNLLLRTGTVEVDSRDRFGRSPFWWATALGHEAVVKLLLDTGKVEVDLKDVDGQTPLWWAAGLGHEAIVLKLLEIGEVDVDIRDRFGQTPLSWAAEQGRETTARWLLDTGIVNIESRDIFGQTPLLRAAGAGQWTTVQLLLGYLQRQN
ncbi:hypothetical protein O9K51_10817 [Purpureocillium lavendulum]|uniref:Uncharacterized protein n=1 Tax=Purpureocillium lavendulum TaxID=1247861 RepID=A0AB34FDZ4_9HYPO|nr:hypothetical protein O9K51_10817 [Purpureocillium lavendulum]